MRQYKRETTDGEGSGKCAVVISVPGKKGIRVEISTKIMDVLDDLQREWWRLERRESRHVLHLELMSESMLPANLTDTPERHIIRRYTAEVLREALSSLSSKQARRLLLHAVEGIPIKEIARREDCSERAIKYSIAQAKKKMRDLLSDYFT